MAWVRLPAPGPLGRLSPRRDPVAHVCWAGWACGGRCTCHPSSPIPQCPQRRLWQAAGLHLAPSDTVPTTRMAQGLSFGEEGVHSPGPLSSGEEKEGLPHSSLGGCGAAVSPPRCQVLSSAESRLAIYTHGRALAGAEPLTSPHCEQSIPATLADWPLPLLALPLAQSHQRVSLVPPALLGHVSPLHQQQPRTPSFSLSNASKEGLVHRGWCQPGQAGVQGPPCSHPCPWGGPACHRVGLWPPVSRWPALVATVAVLGLCRAQ